MQIISATSFLYLTDYAYFKLLIVVLVIALIVWIVYLAERKNRKHILFWGNFPDDQLPDQNSFISFTEQGLKKQGIKYFDILFESVFGKPLKHYPQMLYELTHRHNPVIVLIYFSADWWAYRKSVPFNADIFAETLTCITSLLEKESIVTVLCTALPANPSDITLHENTLQANKIMRLLAAEKEYYLVDLEKKFSTMLYEDMVTDHKDIFSSGSLKNRVHIEISEELSAVLSELIRLRQLD